MEPRLFDTDPAHRPPLCAATPLLWSFLPLAGGILLARMSLHHGWLAAASGLILAAAWKCGRPAGRQRILVACASLGLGWFLMMRAAPPSSPEWAQIEPQEATLRIQVERLFNNRRQNSVSGIGRVQKQHASALDIEGRTLAFQLSQAHRDAEAPVPGETLLCRGRLTPLSRMEHPDAYQQYLLGKSIQLLLDRGRILRSVEPPTRLEMGRQSLYGKAQAILQTGCDQPDDPGHVLASMLLGNRRLLTPDRTDLYRNTGTFHLFAVSGLHVGSVALCLIFLCRLMRLPPMGRAMVALVATWSYVWLTGSSPSAVRAGIMITIITLARYCLRQPQIFPALVVSAWLVLIQDPRQLFDLGFQLSYAVVGAIVLIGLPMSSWLRKQWGPEQPLRARWRRWFDKGLRAVGDFACVSLSASVASMPLILQHFELFTPGGLIAGIILNPLTSLSVMAGCLALLLGLPGLTLPAGGLALATWPAIMLMEIILKLCLALPGACSSRAWIWPTTGNALVVAALATAWALQRLRQSGIRMPAVTLGAPLMIVLGGLLFLSRAVDS